MTTAQVPETLLSMLHCSGKQHADKTAFVHFGQRLSYAQLTRQSDQLAAYLLQCQGLEAGDRVAIMLPNLLQYPVAVAAILKAGLVVTSINPLYTARELHHQLNDSGARAIIILADRVWLLKNLLNKTQLRHVIVTNVGDLLGRYKKLFFHAWSLLHCCLHRRHWFHWRALKQPRCIDWITALAQGQQLLAKRPQVQQRLNTIRQETKAQALAFLQYTGGTTGTPKGAMLSHHNLISNVNQMAEFFPALRGGDEQETIVTALPLYHIFSLTVNLLLFMRLGHCNILIADPRRLNSLIAVLKKERFNVVTAVNTLLQALLDHAQFARLDFSHLHITIGGGMAVHRATAERWQAVTGCVVLQGYGLTETSPVVSVNPPTVETFNGSVGRALPNTEIKICNAAGQPLPRGESGELFVRGPQVMQAYWQQEQATKHVLDADGWLSTGDIAYLDKNDYLFLVDRAKHIIIVSGFNVYPNEVEDVLYQHPGIKEAACIGVNDAGSGQAVKAIVVARKKGQLHKEEIIRFCRQRLTAYKVPKQLQFVDSLPKSAAGKILHRQLK